MRDLAQQMATLSEARQQKIRGRTFDLILEEWCRRQSRNKLGQSLDLRAQVRCSLGRGPGFCERTSSLLNSDQLVAEEAVRRGFIGDAL